MAKFSGKRPMRTTPVAPVRTTSQTTRTHEGGVAYSKDAESDLFLLAVTNMVGEDTFYESGEARDKRFSDLVHAVATSNPAFIAGDGTAEHVGLARYLRETMLMRSASVVMAAEYASAGGPDPRAVVDAVLQRPDEPGEFLSYWMQTHNGNDPGGGVKRGLADAITRMFSERAALRYDGSHSAMRFGDLIDLCHPVPKDERQAQLFAYLLDDRHNRPDPRVGELLEVIKANRALMTVPEEDRRDMIRLHPDRLTGAGMSWERLSSWLPGGMDAQAWEAAIPNMGVMALVRNLRNFDQASISASSVDYVIHKITDAEEVRKARLFPYQLWSAYSHAPSDNWKRALNTTIDLTTQNIPEMDGTLVVIDTSGSMEGVVSRRSKMRRVEVAAVMAMATAKRSSDVDVVIFGQGNAKVDVSGFSVLSGTNKIQRLIGSVGHATYGHTAIAAHFDPKKHRRVVMFTDDQQHDSGHVKLDHVPLIYTFNLAGYAPSSLEAGRAGRYTMGGFTDATFTAMKVLEAGNSASWPF